MHVKHVTISNFKNIEALEQEVDGNNLLLIGENAVGKSSFLQAIMIAVGSTEHLPPNPITYGKDNAYISVITDEQGKEYKFEAKFDTKTNKPKITVECDGMRDKRKGTIAGLVGAVDFDVFEFVELSKSKTGKKKQVEIVESLLPEEMRTELAKYRSNIQTHYDERTECGRNIKAYKGFLEESGLTPVDLETYIEPVDITKMQQALTNAIENNKQIEGVKSRQKTRKEEIKRWEERLATMKEEEKQAEEWLGKNIEVDTTEMTEEIGKAQTHNSMCDKVDEYNKKKETLDRMDDEYGGYTVAIETQRQAIEDAVRDFDFPVQGLSFGPEDNLLLNDKDVDPSTLSTAEIMHLGIQLKMAMNPGLKVFCLEHGESLGTEKLKQIQELCRENGYQIIMEQVQRGTEELQIEIMPDYE